LPQADPTKFRILGHYYGTDGSRVYYLNRQVIGADPATFRVEPKDQFQGIDRNQKYYHDEVV
jgi:hypothetical protein